MTRARRRLAEEEPLLKVQDVARLLSVGKTKVYQMMESGELPFVRLGRDGLRGPRRVRPEVVRKLRGD